MNEKEKKEINHTPRNTMGGSLGYIEGPFGRIESGSWRIHEPKMLYIDPTTYNNSSSQVPAEVHIDKSVPRGLKLSQEKGDGKELG